MRRYANTSIWLSIAIVAPLTIVATPRASAHDQAHQELNNWMKGLASNRGACCDGSDAKRVDDADWTYAENGKFTVMVEGKETTITCRSSDYDSPGSITNDKDVRGDHLPGHYCVRLPVHTRDFNSQDKTIEMAWFFVPTAAEVNVGGGAVDGHVPNLAGASLVWPVTSSPYGENEIVVGIRCFEPGAGG